MMNDSMTISSIHFQSKWRGTLFDFIGTKQFELFIMSVIIANMLTMMIQHHGQSNEVTVALEYLNYLFTGIFTIEAIIRLIAMRLEYFKSFMNVFDFSVVVVSIGGEFYCFLPFSKLFLKLKVCNGFQCRTKCDSENTRPIGKIANVLSNASEIEVG